MGEVFLALRIPRTDIVAQTSALAFTRATVQEIRQVFSIYVLQKVLAIATAENLYLLLCLIVDPHPDDGPNASEEERRIEDEHIAEYFGIVILGHF